MERTDDAFYIPFQESLQQLLNDESILEEVSECNIQCSKCLEGWQSTWQVTHEYEEPYLTIRL